MRKAKRVPRNLRGTLLGVRFSLFRNVYSQMGISLSATSLFHIVFCLADNAVVHRFLIVALVCKSTAGVVALIRPGHVPKHRCVRVGTFALEVFHDILKRGKGRGSAAVVTGAAVVSGVVGTSATVFPVVVASGFCVLSPPQATAPRLRISAKTSVIILRIGSLSMITF